MSISTPTERVVPTLIRRISDILLNTPTSPVHNPDLNPTVERESEPLSDDEGNDMDRIAALSNLDINALSASLNIRATSLDHDLQPPIVVHDQPHAVAEINPVTYSTIPQAHDHDPLIYEIYEGDYSNFRMRMRDLFLRISDITSGIEVGDYIREPIQAVYWREKSNRQVKTHSRSTDGVGRIQSRDLRRLDILYTPQEEPAILIRRHAVLISLDPLRVIVMWNRVVGFVPEGADTLLKTLYINMKVWDGDSGNGSEHHQNQLSISSSTSQANSHSPTTPFEMRAYEAIFGTVVEILKQEEKLLREKIDGIVSILNKYSIVPVKVQDKVRQCKHEVTEKLQRVQAHLNVIQDIMDDDEQMALMNLSLLRDKPTLYRPPLSPEILGTHEEIEAMLDSLIMDYNAILARLNLSRSKLESSEDMVSLRLDTARNQLLITNTIISVLALAFSFGSYVGAIWGMNLDSNLQETKGMFWGITIGTTVTMILLVFGIISYLQYAEIIPKKVASINNRLLKSW